MYEKLKNGVRPASHRASHTIYSIHNWALMNTISSLDCHTDTGSHRLHNSCLIGRRIGYQHKIDISGDNQSSYNEVCIILV